MAALRASNPSSPGLSFRNRCSENSARSNSSKSREASQAFAVDVSGFDDLDSECHVDERGDIPGGPSDGESECGEDCNDVYARGYTLSTPVFNQVSELRSVDHRSLQRLKVPTHRLWR